MEEGKQDPSADTSEDEIISILSTYKRVAIVGLSADESKDSYKVAQFLQDSGFEIFPVNPNYHMILGRRCYARLSDIEDEIEIIDIFRKSEAVGAIVEEAIRKKVKVVWMQEGIVNNEAAERARSAGLKVVMNRCIKKTYSTYFSPVSPEAKPRAK